MRNEDISRLKQRYHNPIESISPEDRLGTALTIELAPTVRLVDTLVADLDPQLYGIGWWCAYPALDRKSRIMISDYLISCGRTIPRNLIEAEVCRLELDHSIDDFRIWMDRGVGPEQVQITPPHDPYDDLAEVRVSTHLAGVLRALASTLDCLAACIVGIAAIPTGIVRTDLTVARRELKKATANSQILANLDAELERLEIAAGPTGWIHWLLGMRNMLVHRGRRIMSWELLRGDQGAITNFILILPRSPNLTEVEAWVDADGYLAAQFQASHDTFLDALSQSVQMYTNAVVDALKSLWDERKANPRLLEQPAAQWKKSRSSKSPQSFAGYPTSRIEQFPVTAIGVSDEVNQRLQAAGLNHRRIGDVGPQSAIWS
jgi:hypothetical protein